MATFTYTNPTVGGSEDTWGTTLNANWTALGAFFGDLDSTELAVLDGITASTAELNLLTGVTASTAELNLLDGVTASTDEINYLSGVTGAIQTQIDNVPQPPALSQVQVEDDTSTVFGQVSGQRLAQAAAVNVPDVLNASGSAPIYACRAWVNFNGTGTVAIRAGGNVSSITDNGTGDFTVNFTTAMEDADFAMVGTAGDSFSSTGANRYAVQVEAFSVSSVRINVNNHGNGFAGDPELCSVSVFR